MSGENDALHASAITHIPLRRVGNNMASKLRDLFTMREVDLIACAVRVELDHAPDKDKPVLRSILDKITKDTIPPKNNDDLRQLLGMKDW